jgi:protein-disulfide isomerase
MGFALKSKGKGPRIGVRQSCQAQIAMVRGGFSKTVSSHSKEDVVKRTTVISSVIGLAALIAPIAASAQDATATRIADYYRRKSNLPPEVTITVGSVQDSKIPGAKSATLELSRGGQAQKVNVLMSSDGRYVVFGDIEDVTADPFAEVMKKINLKDTPSKGPDNAKIVIVEYSDFQCPYCARAHETLSNQVLKEYSGKVRLLHKQFPLAFHKWAEAGSIAALCVYNQDKDAFWNVYDYLFANQGTVTPENVKEKALEAVKDNKKISKDKFNECYDGKKPMDKIKADMAEGQQVGVSGTPAFLINGRKISGAQPFQNFKAIIDDELSRSDKKS